MTRSYGRYVGVLASVLLVGFAASTPVAALIPMTGEQVVETCIEAMNAVNLEAGTGMAQEAIAFGGDVNDTPFGTPIGQVFKMGAAASGRVDKIGMASASKVEKLYAKCITKLNRLGGDKSLIKEAAAAHDQVIESIGVGVLHRQTNIVDRVSLYINPE